MALTLETQTLVATIITQQIQSARDTEFQKHVLAQEKDFLPVNVF